MCLAELTCGLNLAWQLKGWCTRLLDLAFACDGGFLTLVLFCLPEVTRKRLYIETLEKVYSGVDKILLDQGSNGQSVLPYLPVNELINKKGSN